jgi:hypothetical protein
MFIQGDQRITVRQTSSADLGFVPFNSTGVELFTRAAPGIILPRVTPKLLRQSLTATVTAGNSSVFEVTPTTGYVGVLKTLGAYIPEISGATGSHTILVQIGPSASMGLYWAESLYGAYGENGAGLQIYPSNLTVAINGCIFDADNPLLIKYLNYNDLAQTGERLYYILYEEVLKAL